MGVKGINLFYLKLRIVFYSFLIFLKNSFAGKSFKKIVQENIIVIVIVPKAIVEKFVRSVLQISSFLSKEVYSKKKN